MRIDFNTLQPKNIEDPAVTAAAPKSGPSKATSSAPTDGIVFGHSEDNILFRDKSKKKSVMDQAAQADAIGVETQMDQMLVVAQTMSPQDAQKLSEEGYDMGKMDPADAVNSLDRMKIKLAEAGVNVAGYTDTVSADKVAEVTGQSISTADMVSGEGSVADKLTEDTGIYFAPDTTDAEIAETLTSYDLPTTDDNISSVKEAINMTSELQAITENTSLFLASEGMEPTIENVFRAEFSSGKAQAGGNSKYIADDTGYVGMAGNVDTSDKSGNAGKATMDDGLGRQISEIIENAGYENTQNIRDDALSMINAGVPLTPETLQIYEDSKNIDIRPTKREVMNAIAGGGSGKDAYLIADYKNIKSERITKEAALAMSTEVNLKNIDKDVTIDTGYLEKDVESLKAREREAFDLLEETLSVKSDILRAPAELVADWDILGVFASMGGAGVTAAASIAEAPEGAGQELTLRGLHDKATDLARNYERMNQTYEAVGTEVRADLGDSIRKAFANTDFEDILQNIGADRTPENERAVRIASYSHIEVTAENIDRISAADDRLSSLLDKMTPNRVLRLIKDNVNPLETNLEELDRRLTDYEDEEDRPIEDFAKYLVSERDKGNITEEEATSYIGIYRFMNAIESGDHRAVGAVLASGADMNFSTLLSATRSGRKAHIDHYIDDHFSGIDVVFSQGNPRIDQMIRTAFTPDDSGQEYYEEESRRFAEAAKAEAEIYKALEEADIPRSAENINAYEQLASEGGNRLTRDIFESASSKTRDKIREARNRAVEAMGDGDAAKVKEAYDEMVKAELIGALEGETLDIRAMQTKDKVLSVKGSLAQVDEYNVPTEFNGELININLKLRHEGGRNLVDILFETEEFGEVRAEFRVGDRVDGAVRSGKAAGDEYMRQRLDAIKDAVAEAAGRDASVRLGVLQEQKVADVAEGEQVESTMLYRMAKAVLDTMLVAG